MARANATWGEERIAAELLLKLDLAAYSRRYMSRGGRPRDRRPSQQWSTFVRNHASAMLACDFFVTITASFRTLYVFVVLEVGTRRLVHWNVTEHPTADWTVQQFRAVVPGDQPQRFLIHDRDSIHAAAVDSAVAAMGLTVLKTPARCPQANAYCERLIGTIRRECLDWLIVLNERHLRSILTAWVTHYNRGRPHTSLGPGIPGATPDEARQPSNGHRIPDGQRVVAVPILAGYTTNTGWNHWRLERSKKSDDPTLLRTRGRGPRSPDFALDDLEEITLQIGRTRLEQPAFQRTIFVTSVEIRDTVRYVNGTGLDTNDLGVCSLRDLDDEPAITKVPREFLGRCSRQGG
jgi:transposase InsO family protein